MSVWSDPARVDQQASTTRPARYSALLQKLALAARSTEEYSERHLKSLGFLAAFIPLAYVVDVLVGEPHVDTLIIRITAFLAAIPLILHDRLSPWMTAYFHVYFVALIAYALPFSFGLMLVLNAALAPPETEITLLWIFQYLVALFLFIQLIHNGLLATTLWVMASAAALSSLFFLDNINWRELERVLLYPITGYLTALFAGILTNRNVDYVNSEKLKAASAIGTNIAHELRTPLASIRSLANSIKKHSGTLVTTYEKASELGIETGDLTPHQVEGLRDALDAIDREVAYSNTIIEMLLMNTSEQIRAADSERFLASESVEEAIHRYPFNNSRERRLLTVKVETDFQVRASRLLVVHVLFNLLKNGIYYSQKVRGGVVEIVVGPDGSRALEITDTGPGIGASDKKFIFDRFFTSSSSAQGAGVGLSFCRMVMVSLGGSIECESYEGEHTTFRLNFPSDA